MGGKETHMWETKDEHHRQQRVCVPFTNTDSLAWILHAANVTQLHQFTQQSTETPKLLKGHRRRTAGEQMGGSPKAPQQHLAGETSLLVLTQSPTNVAWALSLQDRALYSNLNQDPVHAGVTAVAAPKDSDHTG